MPMCIFFSLDDEKVVTEYSFESVLKYVLDFLRRLNLEGIMKHSVLDHYIGSEGLKKKNCAQAIICGYGEMIGAAETLVETFKAYGGGKAPDNKCGALYAAEYILEHAGLEEKRETLWASFQSEAGSLKCYEIRQLKQLSCLGCVKQADQFLKTVLIEVA